MKVEAAESASFTTLNLGSGRRKFTDAVNLDITPDTDPDVVHDLREFPWPFEPDRFNLVRAIDVIEHLPDVVRTMEEIHRISRPGGALEVSLPHFSSSNTFTDPTHQHAFSYFSFDYFTGAHQHYYYTRARFRMTRRRIVFHPGRVSRMLERFANRYPELYEQRFAWMAPAFYLDFRLEVVK